jgi:hypothetical protein
MIQNFITDHLSALTLNSLEIFIAASRIRG